MMAGAEVIKANPHELATGNDTSGIDLTPPQKAAIILASLSPEFAGPIVERISDDNIQRFLKALRQLRDVPREKILAVIADFIVTMNGRKGMLKAGPDKAMEIAQGILDGDRFDRLTMDASMRRQPVSKGIWGEVEVKSTEMICRFLVTQKAEVAAFILSKLPNDVVSDILMDLPEEKSLAFVNKISEGISFAPFVEKAIEKVVREDFLDAPEDHGNQKAITYVADVLSVIDRSRRESILSGIEQDSEERAQKIKDEMLTFDDLPERLPPTAIQIIFREFDKKALNRMLKAGAIDSQIVTEYLYSNISQRLAGSIRETVDGLDPLNEKEAAKAIADLMSFVSQLVKDERITLIKKAESSMFPTIDIDDI